MKTPSYITLFIASIFVFYGCVNQETKEEITSTLNLTVKSPFEGIDTLATNDWWNRKSNPIIDVKVERDKVIAFGIYTVFDNTLKLSAQLFPLYQDETREVRLEIKQGNEWHEIQKQQVNDLGWSALFRVEDWNDSEDVSYRILHGKNVPGGKSGSTLKR